MFKKLMAILLCLVMVFSLAACGNKENTNDDQTEDKTNVESETNQDENLEEEIPFVSYTDFPFIMDFQFKEQVVYEKDDIKVIAEDLIWDKDNGLTLVLKATNSEGETLGISTDAIIPVYINNTAVRLTEMDSSDDGKLHYNISPKVLAFFDIDNVYTFSAYSLYVHGENWSDKLTDNFDINLTLKEGDVPTFINRGTLLHDKDGIKLYFVEGQYGIYDELSPVIYIVNESDKDAYFTLSDMKLNDAEPKVSNCVTYAKPGQRCAWSLSYDIALDSSLDYDNLDVVFNISIHHGEKISTIDDFSLDWIYGSIWAE